MHLGVAVAGHLDGQGANAQGRARDRLAQAVLASGAESAELIERVPRRPDGNAATQRLLDEVGVEVVGVTVGDEHGIDTIQAGTGPELPRVEQKPCAAIVDRQTGVVDLRHSDRDWHGGRLSRRHVRGVACAPRRSGAGMRLLWRALRRGLHMGEEGPTGSSAVFPYDSAVF